MNFNDLYKKINAIDSGKSLTECNMTECGGDMTAGSMPNHTQQDSVNMNITLSGQGAGGIRDIMDILRNIDQPSHDEPHHSDSMIVSEPDNDFQSPDIDDMMVIKSSDMEPQHDEPMDSDDEETDETYGNSDPNSSDREFYKMAAITAVGDDFASKGKGALKVNGGENPFNVTESLLNHLSNLYNEIKLR